MYRNYDYRYSIYFIVVMASIAIYYIAIKIIDIFYVVSSLGDFDTYYPMLCFYALFLCFVPNHNYNCRLYILASFHNYRLCVWCISCLIPYIKLSIKTSLNPFQRNHNLTKFIGAKYDVLLTECNKHSVCILSCKYY